MGVPVNAYFVGGNEADSDSGHHEVRVQEEGHHSHHDHPPSPPPPPPPRDQQHPGSGDTNSEMLLRRPPQQVVAHVDKGAAVDPILGAAPLLPLPLSKNPATADDHHLPLPPMLLHTHHHHQTHPMSYPLPYQQSNFPGLHQQQQPQQPQQPSFHSIVAMPGASNNDSAFGATNASVERALPSARVAPQQQSSPRGGGAVAMRIARMTDAPLIDTAATTKNSTAGAGVGKNNSGSNNNNNNKRMCAFPGCYRVVKSQGHCQRHGAVAKRCKVLGCKKQAQGTHQGMCKRHYKESIAPPMACQTIDAASAELHEGDPPDLQQQLQKQSPSRSRPAAVASVYEHILPSSITWHPHRSTSSSSSFSNNGSRHRRSNRKAAAAAAAASLDAVPQENQQGHRDDGHGDSSTAAASKDDVSGSGGGSSTAMPLILHLRHGRSKPFGWHRNEERTACGSDPVHVKAQLEPWERQLAMVEILLLSGGTPGADFRDLAHAWGREKGFHTFLASTLCERRGEVMRKVRSDRRAGIGVASNSNHGRNKAAAEGGGGGGGQPQIATPLVPAKRRRTYGGSAPSAELPLKLAADPGPSSPVGLSYEGHHPTHPAVGVRPS